MTHAKRNHFVSSGLLKSVLVTVALGFLVFLMPIVSPSQTADIPLSKITKIKVQVPQSKLDKFNRRACDYKFPATAVADTGRKYGMDADYLKKLVAFWQKNYDWRKADRELNRFDHFQATVDNRG